MLSIARTPEVGAASAKFPSVRAARRLLVKKTKPSTERMIRLAMAADQALDGADPEAALMFITMLRDRCSKALEKAPIVSR